MRPPTARDPWSGWIALGCGLLLVALIVSAVAS